MKIVKWTLFGLFLLVGILAGVAFLLPSQGVCQRSIEINAPRAVIFPLLNDLRQWQEWTPWNAQRDPSLQLEYSEPAAGEGAWYSWEGEELGDGRLVLTHSDPATGVKFDLAFSGDTQLSTGGLKMSGGGDKTEVTWSFVTEPTNNPIGRYFCLVMDRMLGPDFEKGLASLKEVAEKRAQQPPAEEEPSEETLGGNE